VSEGASIGQSCEEDKMALSEQSNFTNKRVVITGAAGGLGSSLCKSFHAAGAYIIAADRDADGVYAS
jgi:FlaA1/EpsC-like NDP-sugar epimerase